MYDTSYIWSHGLQKYSGVELLQQRNWWLHFKTYPQRQVTTSYVDKWKGSYCTRNLLCFPVRRQIVHRTMLKGRERVASRRDLVDWTVAEGCFRNLWCKNKPQHILLPDWVVLHKLHFFFLGPVWYRCTYGYLYMVQCWVAPPTPMVPPHPVVWVWWCWWWKY